MYGFNPYKLIAGFALFVFFTGLWLFMFRGTENAREAAMENYARHQEEAEAAHVRAQSENYGYVPYTEPEPKEEEPPAVLATVNGHFFYAGEIDYPAEEAEVFLVRGYKDSDADLEAVQEYLEKYEPVYYGTYEEGSPEYEEWRVEAEYRMHDRFVNDLRSKIRSVGYNTYQYKDRKVYEAETGPYGDVTVEDVEPGDYLAYCMGRAGDRLVVWVSEVSILEGEKSVNFETSYTLSAVEEVEL